MKLYFRNFDIADLALQGIEIVPYPADEKSTELYKKINKKEFEAEIKTHRNLMQHRKLFAIIRQAIDNGILERLGENHFNELDYIHSDTLEAIRLSKKEDDETLLYILKWLFLPLIETVYPDGVTRYLISSISFQQMDQNEFQAFYDKCLNYIAFKLGITRDELETSIIYG